MTNNNDIDDLLREIIESSEMNHSDKVWTSLDIHLEKKSNKRDKAIIFRLRIAVVVLLFLFGSFTFYYFYNDNRNHYEPLKAFSQAVNVKPSILLEENYITFNSNGEKNTFTKNNFQLLNHPSIENNTNINQTKKQSKIFKSKKINLFTNNKSISSTSFSTTTHKTKSNNLFNKAVIPTNTKNNLLEPQWGDSISANLIPEIITTTLPDSLNFDKEKVESQIKKSNITTALSLKKK